MGGAVSGKVTTLVGVGRDNVQMKLLTLPPAPSMSFRKWSAFQAEREIRRAFGADSSLDFIPVSGDATSANQVLAIASPARPALQSAAKCAKRLALSSIASRCADTMASLVNREG